MTGKYERLFPFHNCLLLTFMMLFKQMPTSIFICFIFNFQDSKFLKGLFMFIPLVLKEISGDYMVFLSIILLVHLLVISFLGHGFICPWAFSH